ncbi:MAG: hypothetical protein SPJ29_09120 [Phocaeicola sp.]|nr:hypothetical protein [Prevotellaceae bacterium]MDY5939869.1 hypothetical protein [Phocaeicola sp.]
MDCSSFPSEHLPYQQQIPDWDSLLKHSSAEKITPYGLFFVSLRTSALSIANPRWGFLTQTQ